jgi:hypothetical protein
VLRVALPDGYDPNSFFARGGDGRQFQHFQHLQEKAIQ